MADLTDAQLAYVEYASLPKDARPLSKEAFAASIGVSDDTLRRWDKTAWMREALERRMAELNITPDRVQEVIDALHHAAVTDRDVSAMKQYMAYVESLNPSRALVEDVRIESLSDEELERAWRDGLATVLQ